MRRRRCTPFYRRDSALKGAVRVAVKLSYKHLLSTQIRLLHIRPGKGCIQCQLRTVDLSEYPRYHALSYVWGDQTDRRLIKVNGTPFLVTRNLYEALETFRYMPSLDLLSPPFSIWVDAICINQNDENEKSHQVPRMMEIYSAAKRVVVFLSFNEHWIHDEERLIHEGFFQRRRPIQPKGPDNNLGLALSLERLTQHPWFERIWTAQEAALARKSPILLHNYHSSIGAAKLDWIHKFAEEKLYDGSPLRLKSMIHLRRWAQNPNHPDIPRFGNPGQMLMQVLFHTFGRKSSILQDRIYGIYGLLQTINTNFPDFKLPIVDYNQPVGRIFADVTKLIIEHTQRTSIITYASIGRRLPGTPTWTSTFGICPAGTTHFLQDNPDGNPELSEDGQALMITAVVTDCCETVILPVEFDSDIPDQSRFMERLKDIEKRLFKPVADRRSLNPGMLWSTLFRKSHEFGQVDPDFDPSTMLDFGRLDNIPLYMMASYFFATKDGFVGWCWNETSCQTGDFICLRSNEAPIILRETSAPNTYEVIGPLLRCEKELSDTTGKVFKRIQLV